MEKNTFKSVILAFRPKTLTAAVIPCLAGSAMAKAIAGSFQSSVLLYAILASLFIQIGTNLVNDASDFKKGADQSDRLGPKRITQAGVLSYKKVMFLAGLSFFIAGLFGIPLVFSGGTPIVVIGAISILMGYAYTSGPFPLAYKGLGDLFVVLFFGLVAVMGIVFLHVGSDAFGAAVRPSLVLGLQIGFLATVLIAINNLRDIDGDTRAGKKTLAVRFGKSFVRNEIGLLSFLPFLFNFYWYHLGYTWAALLPLLALPLARMIATQIFRNEPSELYNKFLAQAGGLHMIFGVLISIGFWIGAS